jgi:hypothetical protein
MTLLTLFLLGLIVVFVAIGIDLNKQLRAYEQQQREHRETILQIASASKKSNKVDQKQPSGKSKGSRVQGKKDTKQNKSKS